MSVVVRLGVVAMLGGCAQLFDLEAPELDSGDDVEVSFEASLAWIGATLETTPLPADADVAWLVEDETETSGYRRIAGVHQPGGRWTARIPASAPTRVEYAFSGMAGFRRSIALPHRDSSALATIVGSSTSAPEMPGATIKYRLALPSPYTAGEAFALQPAGPWGRHDFKMNELPASGATEIGPATVDYNTLEFPGPLSYAAAITPADRLVALRTNASELTAAAVFAPFDLEPSTDLAATLETFPTTMLAVQVDPSEANGRLAAVPPVGGMATMFLQVIAAPGASKLSSIGINLNSRTLVPPSSQAQSMRFGNPFLGLGWESVVLWYAFRTRMAATTAGTVPISAGLVHVASATTAGGELALPHTAGLPLEVTIAGSKLVDDDQPITLVTNRPVEITMKTDRSTDQHYEVLVFEIGASGMRIIYLIQTDTPTTEVPRDVFASGGTYVVRASTYAGGHPAFATGDLATTQLPYTRGFLDSYAFRVE